MGYVNPVFYYPSVEERAEAAVLGVVLHQFRTGTQYVSHGKWTVIDPNDKSNLLWAHGDAYYSTPRGALDAYINMQATKGIE